MSRQAPVGHASNATKYVDLVDDLEFAVGSYSLAFNLDRGHAPSSIDPLAVPGGWLQIGF
jgi:hypothetical protein